MAENASFQYTANFYDLLLANSQAEVYEGLELRVFKGGLVDLFRKLGVSQSYYSSINRALREMGCISLIRRGSRGSGSVVALHHPPEQTEFVRFLNQPLTESPEAAKLAERLEILERRLGGMNIVEALRNMDERLNRLEREREADGTKS